MNTEKLIQQVHKGCNTAIIIVKNNKTGETFFVCNKCSKTWKPEWPVNGPKEWVDVPIKERVKILNPQTK